MAAHWLYDRADRLSDLAARARRLADYLRRERCDAQRSGDRAAATLARRLAVIEGRGRRLGACARDARASRRSDRAGRIAPATATRPTIDDRAAESAALDRLEIGLCC
jgi:hypothetical protein